MSVSDKLVFYAFIAAHLTLAAAAHHAQYFQQFVTYEIQAHLDIDLNQLTIQEELVYINNSPDTLKAIYFHLYLNKYRKRSLALPDLKHDLGGIEIFEIIEDDSIQRDYCIDKTIMKITLHNPLCPQDSLHLKFDFVAMIPPASGRYGYLGMHYDIGNWYITPVVYDRAGWHLNQHIDNEFYQEWGDYKVSITVPQGFMVGATGDLCNKDEVLDDHNSPRFTLKRAGTQESDLVTWQYEAKMVHDFAWTTDPSYVLLQSEWNGITLNVLVLDYNQESWQQVTEWGMEAIKYFCRNYGMYPYKQLTVADTYIQSGGIEYPQIVMINDYINPDYEESEFKALVIHEIAHNWFYGLIANNQTEKEWMDEGFTTFAEIKAMEALFGRKENLNPGERGWLVNMINYTNDDRLENALQYLQVAKFNLDFDQINLHADYLGVEGYMLQYSKMAMVLFMLEYTMGDSVFAQGMKNYFTLWHFRHPYPEDFIAVMEKTAGYDLDWFFEQWLNTNRKLDYSIEKYQGEWILKENVRRYHCRIEFKRKAQIFMPIDFDVTLKDGTRKKYHIPVNNFPKIERDRVILPYWHFSTDNYVAELILPAKIEKIEIDPSLRLMDINRLDNATGLFPSQEFHFMCLQSKAPPLDKYIWEIWPLLLWNKEDIIKLGLNLNGSYLNVDHKIDAELWYKIATYRVDFDFYYSTPKRWLGNLSWIELRLFTLDGRQGGHIGMLHQIAPNSEPRLLLDVGLSNHLLFDDQYLMSPWDKGNVNTINVALSRELKDEREWRMKHKLEIKLKSSLFSTEFDFSQISLEWLQKFYFGYSDWELNLRLFTAYSDGTIPAQFLYNLSGDNSWGEFQEPFYRSKGTLPYSWREQGHLYKAGGGNVRGYAIAAEVSELYGSKIAAVNFDLKMPNPLGNLYLPVIQNISPFVFTDFGSVWNTTIPKVAEFKTACGLSISWDAVALLDYIFNLKRIRFDFPLWLSKVPSGEKNLKFRWQIRFDFN